MQEAKKRKSRTKCEKADADKRIKFVDSKGDNNDQPTLSVARIRQLSFNKLPTEIKIRVFSNLRPRDLIKSAQVNKQWRQLAYDESLWKKLCNAKARYVHWADGVLRRPDDIESWRNYFPIVRFQNEVKRLGTELLDHVFLTSDFQWQIVSFCLEKAHGLLLPHYKLVVGPEPAQNSSDGKPINEEEFTMAINILGVQHPLRSSFFGQIFGDFFTLLKDNNILWEGHLVTLKHNKDGCSMDSLVELIFSNRVKVENLDNPKMSTGEIAPVVESETREPAANQSAAHEVLGHTVHVRLPGRAQDEGEEDWIDVEIYRILLSPSYSIINQSLLGKILHRASVVEEHDRRLRLILTKKKFTSTDLETSTIRLVDSHDDPKPFEIPFQVIGSYSKEYCTWCWSWYNESYTPEQCSSITRLKNLSRQNVWPEANLFNTPVIDCESVFSFAIAHLVIGRLDNPNILVYPFTPLEDGPRIFLALNVPQSLFEDQSSCVQ